MGVPHCHSFLTHQKRSGGGSSGEGEPVGREGMTALATLNTADVAQVHSKAGELKLKVFLLVHLVQLPYSSQEQNHNTKSCSRVSSVSLW